MIKFHDLRMRLQAAERAVKIKAEAAAEAYAITAMELIRRDSQEKVPFRTGHLHDSAELSPVSTQNGKTRVVVSYEADYAAPVHERTERKGAKFLTRALDEKAKDAHARGAKAAREAVRGRG